MIANILEQIATLGGALALVNIVYPIRAWGFTRKRAGALLGVSLFVGTCSAAIQESARGANPNARDAFG